MQRLDWTYEVPPAGAPSVGLEEYVVTASDGEPVGKVLELLRRGEELWLVVESGTPPLRRERRALRWEAVREVDHDALTVVLAARADELERVPALDPSNGVERTSGEPADVDAIRVEELPDALQPGASAAGPRSGPVDRPTYSVAIVVGGVGIFTLLVAVMVAAGADGAWALALFAVPAFLLAAAGVLAYRAWRLPYERR
jgi:hypothetical protein